ncbi:hypothetical protein BDR06DRAFT_971890 [Suillus hirtellus]|nr:hypothetical protein BDR06DRAFT_971890 [Suillus hirtellus]
MDFPSGTRNRCILACSGVSHGENLYRQNTSRVASKATPAPNTAASASITAAPVAATPPTATSAVTPITTTVNTSMLQNPPRHYQLPVRFRDNGSGPTADKWEPFHLKNISNDEEDKAANPPALIVMPVACPSPLQTVMNTARTDPLATGRQDPVTQSRICKACHRTHTFNEHTIIYLKEADWHIHRILVVLDPQFSHSLA